MKNAGLLAASLLVTTACSSLEGNGETAPAAAVEAREGSWSEEARTSEARPVEVADDELALWQDPTFKRQFQESYAAETDIEPRLTKAEGELVLEARDAMAAGETEKAEALIAKKRGEASSATLDFWAGKLALQRDDLPAAVEAYRIALAKFPNFRRAWEDLGQTYFRMDEPQEAAEAFTEVISRGGGRAVTYGLLGYSYLALEDLIAAESALRMANLLEPQRAEWKKGLADALFRQKRFAETISLLDGMIAADPERVNLWLLQGGAFLGLGQLDKAAENFEIVDQLGGATADSLQTLGNIYVSQGVYDLAADAFLRFLEMDDGHNLERALIAAKVLAVRNAVPEAKRVAERIAASEDYQWTADQQRTLLELRARIAGAEGADEEEVEILTAMVERDPRDGQALLLLGEHAERAADLDSARNYYERGAALEDYEHDAKLHLGQLLAKEGKDAEALTYLRRAHELQPSDRLAEYIKAIEQRDGRNR